MSTISEQARFRQEPEDPLDRWRREKAEREEPQPRERKLDTPQLTLHDVDQRIGERIAAEREFMIALMAENNVELKREWVVGAMGPPGPSGPRGEQGPPGLMPMAKLWAPETVRSRIALRAALSLLAGRAALAWARQQLPAGPRAGTRLIPERNEAAAVASDDIKTVIFCGLVERTAHSDGLAVAACGGKAHPVGMRRRLPGIALRLEGAAVVGDYLASIVHSGATIREWKIDCTLYVATPIMSDGSEGPSLELRELFEQFLDEVQ